MKTMLQKTDEANAADYRFERFGESHKQERLEYKGSSSHYDCWSHYHLRETLNGDEFGWCLDVIGGKPQRRHKTLTAVIRDENRRRYMRQNIPYTNDYEAIVKETLEDWNNIRG